MKTLKHVFDKSVYDMELNEELIAEPQYAIIGEGHQFECLPLRILRVPGGWIYYNAYISNVGVFVPLDDDYYSYKRKQRAIRDAEISEGCGH